MGNSISPFSGVDKFFDEAGDTIEAGLFGYWSVGADLADSGFKDISALQIIVSTVHVGVAGIYFNKLIDKQPLDPMGFMVVGGGEFLGGTIVNMGGGKDKDSDLKSGDINLNEKNWNDKKFQKNIGDISKEIQQNMKQIKSYQNHPVPKAPKNYSQKNQQKQTDRINANSDAISTNADALGKTVKAVGALDCKDTVTNKSSCGGSCSPGWRAVGSEGCTKLGIDKSFWGSVKGSFSPGGNYIPVSSQKKICVKDIVKKTPECKNYKL